VNDADKMAAVEKLAAVIKGLPSNRIDFAKSLVHQYSSKGYLSEKQFWWVGKLIEEADVPPGPKKEEPSYPNIRAAILNMKGNGAKAPSLRFAGVTLSMAKDDSQNRGFIYIKVNGEYAGKISPVGRLMPGGGFTKDQVQAWLDGPELNPEDAAISYGRETGRCSCCGRELTNALSIELGIGPICREIAFT
jgi:hypothetical protein